MKNFFYAILVLGFLAGCQGKQGEVGPAGAKGDTGSQGVAGPQGPAGQPGATGPTGPAGPTGPQGTPGTSGTQPAVYDFTLDASKTLASYSWPKQLGVYDVVLVYIKKSESFYSALPFAGYSFTSDGKDFLKVNMNFDHSTFTLYINNDGLLPTGATFLYRAVVLRGSKGGRIDTERYRNYENLKADFNLTD